MSNVVDGAVNGVARAIAWGGWLLRLMQSGQAQHYALGMALGAVVLVTMYLILIRSVNGQRSLVNGNHEQLFSCQCPLPIDY